VIAERCPTDLSDDEYALLARLLPRANWRGRKPTDAREIVNALFYPVRAACVVKRTGRVVKGFIVLLKRRIVDRTLGWLNRARRLAKDDEALVESSSAWLMLALAVLLTRRLGRYARHDA
jgi:transposase